MVVPLLSASISKSKIITYIVAIAVLVIFSAFFSATEMAFSSLNRIRLKNMYSNEPKKYGKVYFLSEHFDGLISTILIGNNIVNIASATLATMLFTGLITSSQELAGTVSTAVSTVVVLIFGEISPKSVAKRNPEFFAKFAAPFLLVFYYILYPINKLMGFWQSFIGKIFKKKGDDNITDEELITYIDEAQIDVEAVDIEDSMSDVMKVFRESGYSRLPVYEENIDTIKGIINLRDFYEAYIDGASDFSKIITKSVIYVPDTMKISDVLRKLQMAKTHIAIVVDEFGGTMGIVTLEDILEQLVGDIWDESDEVVEPIVKLSDNKYSVLGDTNLEEFFDYFEVNRKQEEFDTVTLSGYIAYALGRMPQVGDIVNFENLAITVKKMDNTVVEKVEVIVNTSEEEEKEEK